MRIKTATNTIKDREDKLIRTDIFNTACKSIDLAGFEMVLPGNSITRIGRGIRIKRLDYRNKNKGKDIMSVLMKAVDGCGAFDGVLVSGGIDSSVIAAIAKKKKEDIEFFTSGFPDSEDIKFSSILADSMGVNVNKAFLTDEKIKDIVVKLKSLGLDTYNVIIGITEYSAIKLAVSRGRRKLLSGIGSDELFFGFAKHRLERSASSLRSLRDERLSYINVTDMIRINKIADCLGARVLSPYLNEEIVNFALNMRIETTRDDIYHKTQLRLAGKKLGLDERIVERNKKAMQYGSGVMKHLEKLAVENGIKNVGEYIKRI